MKNNKVHNANITIACYKMDNSLKNLCRIRKKQDILRLLLGTIPYLNNRDLLEDGSHATNSFSVVSGDMRRLVFKIGEDKIMSFVIPFNIEKNEYGNYHIHDNTTAMNISGSNLSILTNIVNAVFYKTENNDTPIKNEVYDNTLEEALEEAIQINSPENVSNQTMNKLKADLWVVLQNLFLFETGYIRYDYDEQHANGHKHPLCHYDINYSNLATFKLGLQTGHKTNINDIINFLYRKTDASLVDCKFKPNFLTN